jgi:hypothetical protein
VNNDFGSLGLSRAGTTGTDLYDWNEFANGPVANWNMLTSFGPVSGAMDLSQWDSSPLIQIQGGQFAGDFLHFDDEEVQGSFQATVTPGCGNNCGGGGNPVPEPISVLVIGPGLIGLLMLRRQKKALM